MSSSGNIANGILECAGWKAGPGLTPLADLFLFAFPLPSVNSH